MTGVTFSHIIHTYKCGMRRPDGWRYPLVGGTRQRHFDGTRSKPRKLPENAPTPTTMAPALARRSGARYVRQFFYFTALLGFEIFKDFH